ncbi:hypothetical protein [uncultured Hymenobacter sp.]|uniref:hypothetical protein n=1 Tax=uncultured Hymenobacter sp. TaxID=170016 RepID=UPI0035CA30C5
MAAPNERSVPAVAEDASDTTNGQPGWGVPSKHLVDGGNGCLQNTLKTVAVVGRAAC